MASVGPLGQQHSGSEAEPRSQRGRQRRAALLTAARALFLSEGYENTSFRQIVQQAGGSLSTAYQLFGNKAGIFRAVMFEVLDHVRQQALPDVWLAQPPRVAVPKMAEQLLTFSVDPEIVALKGQLIAESRDHPELAVELHESTERYFRQPLQAYFTQWAAQGQLPPIEPAVLTSLFLQMCCSWHLHHLLLAVGQQPSRAEIQQVAAAAVRMLCPPAAADHGALDQG